MTASSYGFTNAPSCKNAIVCATATLFRTSHGPRAAETFLGGLEDEVHGAVEIPGLGQIARGAEQHESHSWYRLR